MCLRRFCKPYSLVIHAVDANVIDIVFFGGSLTNRVIAYHLRGGNAHGHGPGVPTVVALDLLFAFPEVRVAAVSVSILGLKANPRVDFVAVRHIDVNHEGVCAGFLQQLREVDCIAAVCTGRGDLHDLAALGGIGIVYNSRVAGNAVAVELDALCGIGGVLGVVLVKVVVPDERTEFFVFGRNIGFFVYGSVAGVIRLVVL